MENVIQKYLRNEFAVDRGIQPPGRRGGRAVSLSGGGQLSGQLQRGGAATLAVSIAASGPRCGVYTLCQRRHAAAAGRRRVDSPTWSSTPRRSLARDGSVSAGAIPSLGRFPLELDAAAAAAPRSPPLVQTAGRHANEARPRRGAVRDHRAAGRGDGGRSTAAAASTCRWAAPAPRSCNTCSWATAPRSTCSSPARPARANRRCCTP